MELLRQVRQTFSEHAPTWREKAARAQAILAASFETQKASAQSTRSEIEREICQIVESMRALGASVETGAYHRNFAEREGIDRVNLIKMDVDGQELQVLQGGLRVLKEFQPLLVIEISPYVQAEHNNSFGRFVSLLRDAGYSLQDATTWNPLPLDAGRLEALIPDGASINAIARPKNRH